MSVIIHQAQLVIPWLAEHAGLTLTSPAAFTAIPLAFAAHRLTRAKPVTR